MIDVTQPVPTAFIAETVAVIFAVIGAGIYMVRKAKRTKEGE
ncbi:MAG: hypothetical protein AB7U26_03535 [Sulfuricurvum sp.]|jgi:hypothetical protein|nr:hypothetical protein [Sulfuricurvum sp. IAE1]MDD3770059.1 hypothetical protein [Sulfuricurvum sp.]MDX9965984.1 hypothetical protein [Sulfuricurvum sp.]